MPTTRGPSGTNASTTNPNSTRLTFRLDQNVVAEEKADQNTVSPSGLTVRWRQVTQTLDGRPVDITGYEVIVTRVNFNDPNGLSRPEYDVHVPPDVTELAVPEGFLQPGTLYELEVLALEDSGNQTISVGFFTAK
jgi:hypothetical protein